MPDQMKVAFIMDEIRVKNDGKSITVMIETIKRGPVIAKLYFCNKNIENNCKFVSHFLLCIKNQNCVSHEDTTIYISGSFGIVSMIRTVLEQKPKRIFYEKGSLKNVPEGEKFHLHKIALRLNVPVIGVN